MDNISRIEDGKPFVPLAQAPTAPVINAPYNVAKRRFVSTPELAGRLGFGDASPRTVIARLRVLHLQAALPLPITPRIVGGTLLQGAEAIHWRSQFDRAEIMAWIEDGASNCAPTRPAAQDAPSRIRQTRASLASRAALALPRKRECAA